MVLLEKQVHLQKEVGAMPGFISERSFLGGRSAGRE